MNTGTKDESKGKFHEVKGKVKEKVGQVTNNPDLEAKGKAEHNIGTAEKKVGQVEQRLRDPKSMDINQTRRLSYILREKNGEICRRILAVMKSDPELAALPLTDEQRLDHTQIELKELACVLEENESPNIPRVDDSSHQEQPHQKPVLPAAAIGGKERQEQKYPIALLAVNARLLQGVIYEVIHENMLSINLSYLMLDLKRLNEALALQAEEIIRKFLQAEKRTA
jgi:uncharacterized protein YjbJ (UPF0337 family)